VDEGQYRVSEALYQIAKGSASRKMSTRTLIAGVSALFLATGTAHANHQAYYQCGKDLIFVNMGKGFTDYALVLDKKDRPLPSRFFRWNDYHGILYYRGRKCQWREWP
jgi:hypothetical protein